MEHFITKIDLFKIRFKNLGNFGKKALIFISLKNEMFGFFENFEFKRKTYIKEPISVKFKCNGKYYDKSPCGKKKNN
jgi:hypothetical protein